MSDIENEVIEDKNEFEVTRDAVREAMNPEPEIEATETPEVEIAPEPEIEMPKAWEKTYNDKWKTLDPEVRKYIQKREEEAHKSLTAHDEDRNFGRTIKEVVTPYLPYIQQAGSTPKDTMQNLLNTAYNLAHGDPASKAAMVREIIQTYNVDMGGEFQQDLPVQSLLREIEQLKRAASPEYIKNILREEQENASIKSEVEVFASNPEHKHYEAVKPTMAILLGNGQAQDLKEAYDMACWANPAIRSLLTEELKGSGDAKRQNNLAVKKNAAASVTSSPATPSNFSSETTPQNEYDATAQELRKQLRAATGKI